MLPGIYYVYYILDSQHRLYSFLYHFSGFGVQRPAQLSRIDYLDSNSFCSKSNECFNVAKLKILRMIGRGNRSQLEYHNTHRKILQALPKIHYIGKKIPFELHQIHPHMFYTALSINLSSSLSIMTDSEYHQIMEVRYFL